MADASLGKTSPLATATWSGCHKRITCAVGFAGQTNSMPFPSNICAARRANTMLVENFSAQLVDRRLLWAVCRNNKQQTTNDKQD